MREVISVVSFVMAAIGALATLIVEQRDKQIMASIVGMVFLLSFFINVDSKSELILRTSCVVFFSISVLGGVMAIFSNVEMRRTGSIITGIVSLGASLLILFAYIEFKIF
jgi:hypothetical protein